ncbi:MAG: hypothetical protein GY763_14205 [Gammaproteobacteria bacterium]|nr:hypothetical protein [Gammaproteobacteria bacterium]
MSMREMAGRPLPGMRAGLYSIKGGKEQAQLQFLILKQQDASVTAELQHIVRKTPDPTEWAKNGLRILAERYYQDDFNFCNKITALFSVDSDVATALVTAGECHLKFKQDSVEHSFDFGVSMLDETNVDYQATWWHNRLFNPTLPGKVIVLEFVPRLDAVD